MSETTLESFDARKERDSRREQMAILESTEGFPLLSELQKRIIEVSLYIQQRSMRTTDLYSAMAVIHYEDEGLDRIVPEENLIMSFPRDKDEILLRKYRASQNMVARQSCHGAIAWLEKGGLINFIEGETIRDGFFEAEYCEVKSFDDLVKRVESFGFPGVLHVNDEPSNVNYSFHQRHSALALGHDGGGSVIVWEKEAFSAPYRINTLRDLYDRYGKRYWGFRRLRSY